MRFLLVLCLLLLLTGCGGSPYWLLKVDHTSNPSTGYPFNILCDPTEDFAGFGVGREWKHDKGSVTSVDGTLGYKRIRQCGLPADGLPARDETSTGAQLEIRHKIPMR